MIIRLTLGVILYLALRISESSGSCETKNVDLKSVVEISCQKNEETKINIAISEFYLRIECFNVTQSDFDMIRNSSRLFKRQSFIEFIDCPLPLNDSLINYIQLPQDNYVKVLVFKSGGANIDRILKPEHIEGFNKMDSLTLICEENCQFPENLFQNMKKLNYLTLSGKEFPAEIFKPLANYVSINITTDGKTVNTHEKLVCLRCNEINQILNLDKIPHLYIPEGRITTLSLYDCEFNANNSIKSAVTKRINVQNVTEIQFHIITKTFAAKEFQGFDKVDRLTLYCVDKCNYEVNLFEFMTNITELTINDQLGAINLPAVILKPLNKLKTFKLDNHNIKLDIQKDNIKITCLSISCLFLEIIPIFYLNTSATKIQINCCILSSNLTQSALTTKFRIVDLKTLELNTNNDCDVAIRIEAGNDDEFKFDERMKIVKQFNFPNLEYLNIDDRITLKNVDAKHQGKTWKLLKLVNNQIANCTRDYFDVLGNVLILQLTSNRIDVLETNVFDHLDNLQKLDLTGNQLKSLPSQMFHFNNNLRHFRLVDNFVAVLETLPINFLTNLQGLEEVVISNESLRQLPEDIFFGSTKILKLTIVQTDLIQIPKYLLRDQILIQHFNLSDNKVEELDDDIFGSSKKLQVLQLSNNKLQNISK